MKNVGKLTNCQAKAFENTFGGGRYIHYIYSALNFLQIQEVFVCAIWAPIRYIFCPSSCFVTGSGNGPINNYFLCRFVHVVMLLLHTKCNYAVLWYLCANIKKPKSNRVSFERADYLCFCICTTECMYYLIFAWLHGLNLLTKFGVVPVTHIHMFKNAICFVI